MDIRCTQCGTLTPVMARSKRVEFLVDCLGCGRGYCVSDLQRLAPRHHSRVLRYAHSNQLAIAAAYIALPGVIETEGGVTGVATAAPAERDRPRRRVSGRLVLGLVAGAAVLAVLGPWRSESDKAMAAGVTGGPPGLQVVMGSGDPGPDDPVSSLIVHTDDSGRVVKVTGPGPGDVLSAFCYVATSPRRRPVEIVYASAEPGVRLGVFTDDGLGLRRAITIRRQAGAHQWVAGDGRGPIPVSPAPEVPVGTPRVPVQS